VLDERTWEIGVIREGRVGPLRVSYGVLRVGEARSSPLIEALLDRVPRGGVTVIDGPPGTACAAAATVRLSDRILLVAEPTPAGLHDLQRMVELCRAVDRPVVAVLNRADLGNAPVERYLSGERIPLWARIPWDRAIAEAGAEGRMAAGASHGFSAALEAIVKALALPGGSEGAGVRA
jgi:MinD superfamily P-loop ATPase